jgi:PAS domain S-box-containing protein
MIYASFVLFFFLILTATLFFVMIGRLRIVHALKGVPLIAIGMGLVFLNLLVDTIFHNTLELQNPADFQLHSFRFLTGYLGETLGIVFIFLGIYRNIRSLVPHLSEYYSNLVEHSLVGVYLIQDDVFKFVNPKFAKIFGYEREELIGRPIVDLIAPEWIPAVVENLRKRIAGEAEALHYSFTGRKKNGERVDVEVYGTLKGYLGKPAIHGTLLDISERAHANEELQKSENRFRAVVESLGEGVIITDIHDVILYVNSRMAEMCGYKPGELWGTQWFRLLLPEEEWIKVSQRTQKRLLGESERYECVLTRKDKSDFYAEVYATPFKDSSGVIVGTLSAITDVSQRKDDEKLQAALFKISEEASTDVEMVRFYANVHSIIGELMNAKNFYIALYDESTAFLSFPYFVDEFDPAPPPRAARRGFSEYVIRTGSVAFITSVEVEELNRLGEIELIGQPSVEWLGVPLMSEGKTFGVIAVQSYSNSIHFTERDREILTFVSQHIGNAIQRKADAEKFRTLWEHSVDGMRLTDKDGTIVMVNSTFCAMMQLPQQKLIGQHFSSVYKSRSTENELQGYSGLFTKESMPSRLSSFIVLQNGAEIWVEISNSFIEFGPNRKMMLSVFRDITQQKKLEEQLLHAQKMESVGVLAGGIAHDFNNVLSMVLGAAEFLKKKVADNPQASHYADIIATAAERGASIAKQLLLFARSEKATLKPLSISHIVLEVQKLLEHTLPKSISIRTEITDPNCLIMGDTDQLHHSLLNLALNARDALVQKPEGGVVLFRVGSVSGQELRKEFSDVEEEHYHFVSVSDNGVGMDEETQRRIFEPFFSTKERGKGTGLGLSIAHGVVQNHRGRIAVESEEGKGTTITFYFPAIPQNGTPIDGNRQENFIERERSTTNEATILIVDDERALVMMLSDVLKDEGYRILTASDGVEAVETYLKNKGKISLVISDLGMPNMGGEEAFKRIKEFDPTARVIFATGYFENGIIEEQLPDGVLGVLHKPFKLEEIISTVRSVLNDA